MKDLCMKDVWRSSELCSQFGKEMAWNRNSLSCDMQWEFQSLRLERTPKRNTMVVQVVMEFLQISQVKPSGMLEVVVVEWTKMATKSWRTAVVWAAVVVVVKAVPGRAKWNMARQASQGLTEKTTQVAVEEAPTPNAVWAVLEALA